MRHARPVVLFSAMLLLTAGAPGPAVGMPGVTAGTRGVATGTPGPATGAREVAVLSPDASPSEQVSLDLEMLLDALGIDVLAVDMFLKIEGIEGEATAAGDGHDEWIEILSFSWGASSPSTGTGRARGTGRASFSDMSVVKRVDASSPGLYLASASGKRLPSAVLEVRKPGTRVSYYTIRMDNVRISSVSVSSSKDSAEPVEEVTLTYGKISWEYVPPDDAGRGARHEATWDLEANKRG